MVYQEGAYAIYGNELSSGSNATNYGFLYNWYAAKGIATPGSTTYKNLCPTGYHVPTDSDWNKLVKFIDSGADTTFSSSTQSTSAGTELKKMDARCLTNTGTDDFCFLALPGGFRLDVGSFGTIRPFAFFWSINEIFGGSVERLNSDKKNGLSVRCLND